AAWISESNGAVPVGGLANFASFGTHPLTYTPSPSCGTATFGSITAKQQLTGKADFVQFDATITALGTCTNVITINLPFTSGSGGGLVGRETAVSGAGVNCSIAGSGQTTAACAKVSGANFALNERVIVSGWVETQ